MTLQEQLDQVKEQLSALDNNNRDHLADISKLKAQETELTNQIALEEAEQQRIQVQEEKVASITLPHDFSTLFEDPRANDIIIEVIQQFQRQAYEEHNQEVSELVALHRGELNAAAVREADLKLKLDIREKIIEDGTAANKELTRENGDLRDHIAQVNLERDDAFAKRDAAVAKAEGLELLVSEKQAQIDKLRDEIAIGAVAAVKVVDVSPTDRLAKLIEESKQAKVKSALDIALENNTPFRGKVTTGAVAELQTPEVQPFQPVNQTGDTASGLDTIYPFIVPAIDTATVEAFRAQEGEVQGVRPSVDEGDSSVEVAGKTLEEAFRRIEALEATVSGMNFQR